MPDAQKPDSTAGFTRPPHRPDSDITEEAATSALRGPGIRWTVPSDAPELTADRAGNW